MIHSTCSRSCDFGISDGEVFEGAQVLYCERFTQVCFVRHEAWPQDGKHCFARASFRRKKTNRGLIVLFQSPLLACLSYALTPPLSASPLVERTLPSELSALEPAWILQRHRSTR